MRYGILFMSVVFAALQGCAHISHQDPQTGLEVTYTGPAQGATALIEAVDDRPYDLAETAMDKGMATSLSRDEDGVRFSAGYGYTHSAGGSVGGYAAPNTGYIPGQGFVTGPPQSSLPLLATSVVRTGVPTLHAGDQPIVPCPTDRDPTTVPEQAACAAAGVISLSRHRSK